MPEGRVRPFGQAAERRWEAAPDVPTFREQGSDMVAGSARGIVGPSGLRAPIRGKLERAFTATLADPAFLGEAQRVFLPLRPLVGTAYRDMAARVEASVRCPLAGAALEQLTRGRRRRAAWGAKACHTVVTSGAGA